VHTQPSFDDLSTPLFDVTFAVLDLETTGLSPDTDRITEIGVVKARGGDVLGEFSTLVHPGRSVPPSITAVTGITDRMLTGQPSIGTVLPALLEFLRGTVLVAHNASFDTRFLAAALAREGHPPLRLPVVDTAAVARRVLRDEVRSCRLAELARHYRSPVDPEHRALPDARATLHVLHGLLERVGVLGATTLQDLQDYTRSTSDRSFRKIDLVRDAPEAAGVYRFIGEGGEVLYVGKATNLRSRLRTYFGQDRRRRVADLVRDAERVEWTVTPTPLEAAVREVRAISADKPRYNRRSKFPERGVWIKLTVEAFPRLSQVGQRRDDGADYLGPLRSRASAQAVIEAIHTISRIRQCSPRLRIAQDHPACVLKDLGRCDAPCDGSIDRGGYTVEVDQVRGWLRGDAGELLDHLHARMVHLATTDRFEDASAIRDRMHAVAHALARDRLLQSLARVDELVAQRRAGSQRELVLVRHGRLAASSTAPLDTFDEVVLTDLRDRADVDVTSPEFSPEVTPESAEEVELVAGWLVDGSVELLEIVGTLAEPVAGGAAVAAVRTGARALARRLRQDRLVLRGDKVAERSAPSQGAA
jgi:DNA polymerase-3 subunit epsilon